VDELEEAGERYFWGILLRGLWTALIFLLVLGILASLTVFLGWWQYLVMCVVGLLTGVAIVVAVLGSAGNRERVGLILGTITLPLLAAYLGGVAGRSRAEFGEYSASLFPFLAHAAGALLGGLWIGRVWRGMPERPRAGGHEARADGTGAAS
jgi:hypothetical protein